MDFNSLKISGLETNKTNEYEQLTHDVQQRFKKDEELEHTVKADEIKANTNTDDKKDSAFTLSSSSKDSDEVSQEDIYSGSSFEKKIKDAIEEANKKLQPVNKEFTYSIHEKTNRIIVTIKDSDTDETLRELPSEESLDMLAKIRDMTGIVVDQKR